MKQLIVVLFLALVVTPGCISNMKNWKKRDKVLAGTFTSVCLWDAYKTNITLSHPDSQSKGSAIAFAVIGLWGTFFIADEAEDLRPYVLLGGTIIGFNNVPNK